MERCLDVSNLEPCEPLERTIEAVKALSPGEYLRVVHRREPHLLYPLLREMGFAWHTRARDRANYEIFVWSIADPSAESAVARRMGAGGRC